MNRLQEKKKETLLLVVLAVVGLIALHNQRLAVTDPENTWPKRIKRAVRLLLDPPANELEKHLIGKGVHCPDGAALYQNVAAATVLIKSGGAQGAGVFIAPRLIVTAEHVVDGRDVAVYLAESQADGLAKPGKMIEAVEVHRVAGLDLAFVATRTASAAWLPLDNDSEDDKELLIVGHPKGKYYSLQRARIKKKDMRAASDYVVFKDNELFFGNSGGAIVGCSGSLVGVVSMMSNYDSSRLKQGIGINARAIAAYMGRLRLG